MAKLRITLVRSGISCPQEQRKTLRALGLRKLNGSVVQEDSASLRGMINQVRHLVRLEEAD
ncbi:MAG: 50S ribosomal protein L30 [Chloroflexi bacterium]|nr:50S ribosomal protein L30 [Chloroflexota bacterium]